MPGLELFGSSETATAPTTTVVEIPPAAAPPAESNGAPSSPGAYYNPRLDPKNFLEGPLSLNAATRLRQMLARPGIVVSASDSDRSLLKLNWTIRSPLVFAMVSAHAAPLRQASLACIRGQYLI